MTWEKNFKFKKSKITQADILVLVIIVSAIFISILLHLDWTRLL
jgi:hypothetical protein